MTQFSSLQLNAKHLNKVQQHKESLTINWTEQNQSGTETNGCPRLSESRLQQWRRRLMEKAQWLVSRESWEPETVVGGET